MPEIVAVGDIMLGRGVAEKCNDYSKLMSCLEAENILRADIVMGNLECLLGQFREKNSLAYSHFFSKPHEARKVLKHFDLVSLANNHVFDFKDVGIDTTLEFLKEYGVKTVGVGRTVYEANNPQYFQVKDLEVAVFGTTTVGNPHNGERKYVVSKPDALFREAVSAESGKGRFVVINLHAGGGDYQHPSPATRSLFRELFSSGANLIVGHHPHLVQGYMQTDNALGFFSLGDFIFDKFENGRNESLILKVHSLKDLSKFEVLPILRRQDLRLEVANEGQRYKMLQKLAWLSEKISTGESDDLYQEWFGNPYKRLLHSFLNDFKRGGILSVLRKIKRFDKVKMKILVSGFRSSKTKFKR